jgi:hypothetical protein
MGPERIVVYVFGTTHVYVVPNGATVTQTVHRALAQLNEDSRHPLRRAIQTFEASMADWEAQAEARRKAVAPMPRPIIRQAFVPNLGRRVHAMRCMQRRERLSLRERVFRERARRHV